MQEKENGKTNKYTEVVAALIVKDGRYLICRRPYGKARGGLWEFVGGKVEKGETKQQALKRECMEELAAQIDVGEEFCSVTHVYPDLTVHLTVFYATLLQQPHMLEHMDMKWILRSQTDDFVFLSRRQSNFGKNQRGKMVNLGERQFSPFYLQIFLAYVRCKIL